MILIDICDDATIHWSTFNILDICWMSLVMTQLWDRWFATKLQQVGFEQVVVRGQVSFVDSLPLPIIPKHNGIVLRDKREIIWSQQINVWQLWLISITCTNYLPSNIIGHYVLHATFHHRLDCVKDLLGNDLNVPSWPSKYCWVAEDQIIRLWEQFI